jgi:hypothetical protein
MPCDHCALCGMELVLGVRKRFFNVAQGQIFVQERCKPTPFLYAFLVGGGLRDGKQYLCIPCVNWKRRAEHGTLRRTKQPILQLDQMILFLMQPGRFQEPDHRCMERLVMAVRQPGNLYRHIFPIPVKTIVDAINGDTYLHCVVAWWKYNGNTEFFSSAQEAKRVRGAVKAGLA